MDFEIDPAVFGFTCPDCGSHACAVQFRGTALIGHGTVTLDETVTAEAIRTTRKVVLCLDCDWMPDGH